MHVSMIKIPSFGENLEGDVCIDAAHLVAFGYCAYRQCSCAQAPTPNSMLPFPKIGTPTTFEFCSRFEFFERFREQDLDCLLGTITMPKARTQPVKRLRNPQPARVDRSYARAQPPKSTSPRSRHIAHMVAEWCPCSRFPTRTVTRAPQ